MRFRMVAEDCKLPVACIVGAWAYLQEHASRSDERGSIADVDFELMAYTLGLPDMETVCNALKRRKLVDAEGNIAEWSDRQRKKESSEPPGASTDRVRKYREKIKANKNKGLEDDEAGNVKRDDVTDETARNGTKRAKRKREEEEIKPKPSSSAGADGGGVKLDPFDQFWDAYPWKAGRQDAQRAWVKIKPDADKVALILAAVQAQKLGGDWLRENGRFIPRAATWLNGGRWLDEVRPYIPPPIKLPAGWWTSHEGMKAAGAMLKPPLEPRSGELPSAFKLRIEQAIGRADPSHDAAPTPLLVEAYVPPAPPEGVQLTDEQRQARREEFREAMAKMKQTAGVAGVSGKTE